MAEGTKASDSPQVLDLERRIVEICQEHLNGVKQSVLQEQLNSTGELVLRAINRLLSQRRISILKQKSGELMYKLQDPEAAKKVKGADNEEKVIYQIISEAGNKGIWIRDIRIKSNLAQTLINKILKNLESKQLIKSIKSVAAGKKKVYMLYDLKPDHSVTGGAWYSDQDFESEFVDVLNQQCHIYLLQKAEKAKRVDDPVLQRNIASATTNEMLKHISDLGISKVELSPSDIDCILHTLVYDGKIEKDVSTSSSSRDSSVINVYRTVQPFIESTGLVQIPCGFCPVIDRCFEGGEISPATCVYFKEWLQY